jgi:hypothetical protein
MSAVTKSLLRQTAQCLSGTAEFRVNLFGQLPVLAEQNFRLPCRHRAVLKLTDYGPWFDTHKRLRELVAELEEISLAIAEADTYQGKPAIRPCRHARQKPSRRKTAGQNPP